MSSFQPGSLIRLSVSSRLRARVRSLATRFDWLGTFITCLQVVADFLAVLLAYLMAYWIYVGPLSGISPQSLHDFGRMALVAGGGYIVLLDRENLYRREISLLNIKELRGIVRVGIFAAMAIFSFSFYFRSFYLSRITLTSAVVFAPVFLYVQRQLFYRLHILFHQRGWSQQKVFIYGAGKIGIHLARRMFESPSLGLLPVAFLDDEVAKSGTALKWSGVGPKHGLPVFSGERWIDLAKNYGVKLVMIALPSATFARNQQLVELCVSHGIEYAIVPNSYESYAHNVELFEVGGIPILRRKAMKVSLYYFLIKRIIDILLATVLIILGLPLAALISIAIKFDSPGPIIFKQKRVGLNGRLFSFYKFRTMHVDAPVYAITPQRPDDCRISRAGRWLRRTSLDELPQVFNVLRGDMSFVGPRPEMPFIVEEYTALEKRRLAAKPGITGVWQISAVRGEPIHANIEYDLFYLDNRSLLLDFSIIWKTFLSVIRGIGAF